MVYKKFIKKGGRTYGPYLYKSQRVDGRVVTQYVSRRPLPVQIGNSLLPYMLLFIFASVILISAYYLMQNVQFSPNERSFLDVKDSYSPDSAVQGNFTFFIYPGELIPKDSLLKISLASASTEIPIQNLLSSATEQGNFNMLGIDISGSGEGFSGNNTAQIFADISSLNIPAEPGLLNISLLYNNLTFYSISKNIAIENVSNIPQSPPEPSNVTNVTNPANTTNTPSQNASFTPTRTASLQPGTIGASTPIGTQSAPLTTSDSISSCTTLSTQGTTYTLTQNVAASTTCMIITASDITLDCQGFTITFGSDLGSNAYGISATSASAKSNLVIKNCVIKRNNQFSSGNAGISLVRFSSSLITNNTINVSSDSSSYGIILDTNSNNVNIINNIILLSATSSSNEAVELSGVSGTLVQQNNITFSGGTGTNRGIHSSFGSGITIDRNIISSSGSSTFNHGILFDGTASGMTITNNTISALGSSSNNGIRLYKTDDSLIQENNISTGGTAADNHAIFCYDYPCDRNTIKKNLIYSGFKGGTLDNHGIWIRGSNNNITYNSISTKGTSGRSYGILLDDISPNNTLDSNVFNSIDGDAIYLDSTTAGRKPTKTIFRNNSFSGVDDSFYVEGDFGMDDNLFIDQYIQGYYINRSKVIFENTQFGKISFSNYLDASGTNLSNDILITNNSLAIDQSKSGLNKTANITFYNIPSTIFRPNIFVNNQLCNSTSVPYCKNYTHLSGTAFFNSSISGTYRIGETRTMRVTIVYPTSGGSYNKSALPSALNYSVPSSAQTCWFFDGTDTEIITCGVNVTGTVISAQGNVTWSIGASDLPNDAINLLGDYNVTNITFSVDSLLPTLITNIANATYFTSSSVTLQVNSTDDHLSSIMLVAFNSGNSCSKTSLTSPNTKVCNLEDGPYQLNYSASDSFGNTNSSFLTFFVDTMPPFIGFASPTPSNGFSSVQPSIPVNISFYDANTITSLIIRFYNSTSLLNTTSLGPFSAGSSSFFLNFTGLAEDDYYVNATITDSASNVNNSGTRHISVDPAPTVVFTAPTENNGDYFARNNIIVNVTASDKTLSNITVYLYRPGVLVNSTIKIASGNPTNYFVNFTNLSQGIYMFNATALDSGSNLGATNETRTVIIDPAPQIQFEIQTETNGSAYHRSNIAINVSASHQNLTNITLFVYNRLGLVDSFTTTATSPVNSTSIFVNLTSLPDEVYFFNATAYDLFSNKNSTQTNVVYIDNGNPFLAGKTRNNALQNGNVNLSINGTDAVSSIVSAIATVYYPNGTFANYSMQKSGNIFNLTLLSLALLGDYDVNYSLVDLAGNTAVESEYFDIYTSALNVHGNVKDAFGNLRSDINYTFLRPGTNIALFSFMNSTYNLNGNDVHQRVYDLELAIGQSKVRLLNLNMTSDFIPIEIDNITSQSVPLYKVISDIGVNSTFTGNAIINFSYITNDLSGTAFAGESNGESLTVHKCSSWDYAQRSCTVSFATYDNKTLFNTTNNVVVNTNGFSAFALTASTCGASGCQPEYGETASTCSIDCSSGGGGGGSSGGGGGGGGSSGTTTVKQNTLRTSITNLDKELAIGEVATENLVLVNSGSKEYLVKITFDPSLSEVLFVSSPIIVSAFNSTSTPITITGVKAGAYLGDIHLTSENFDQIIPVQIIVKSESEKLLYLTLNPEKSTVAPGEKMNFDVKAFNLGQTKEYNLKLTYSLVNKQSNKTIFSEDEYEKIENSISLQKTIIIPKNASLGNYLLKVKATYDEKSSEASASIVIGGKSTAVSLLAKEYLPLIMTLLVLIFILIVAIYYYIFLRKKLFEKKLEELKKNSPYPFPDFEALPKSKFAYIGQVADSLQKTYLDYTQLNRHTLIAGGTGSGKTIAGMVVVEELLQKGVSVVVLDPVGQWGGFAKKCEDASMKAKYKRFGIRGPKAFSTTAVEINDLNINLNILDFMKRGKGLTVLRMDKLTPKKADQFVELCLEKIYRAGLSETSSLRYLLVLDEVHRLLPKYGGRKAYLKLEQAVREFRKWGLGLLMISQVLTDFKGAIRGNIGTEIQMHTRYEGDIKRVRERHGSTISKLMSKLPIGLGMLESSSYNKGNPYFIEFRPILHSPFKPEAKVKDQKSAPEQATAQKAVNQSGAPALTLKDLLWLLNQGERYVTMGNRELAYTTYQRIKALYESLNINDDSVYRRILNLYNDISKL